MLQQTQVATVIPYWKRWMRELPSIKALAAAPEEKVLKLWEGLGYYRRARNLQKGARQIRDESGGRFPTTLGEVLRLPGVGRYTAGAICSIAFNQPTPIVDGNVVRVLTRAYGIDSDPTSKPVNERLWAIAAELVEAAESLPKGEVRNCSDFNQSLMELGAVVCSPTSPACDACPLRLPCVARREGRQHEMPAAKKAAPATARLFEAFVLENKGRFLVRQRPADAVNGGLWEFPSHEPAVEARPECVGDAELRPFCVIKHSITRYRITVRVSRGTVRARRKRGRAEVWLPLPELEKLAFTSAHRKILRRLAGG